jgi:hypothetical protein
MKDQLTLITRQTVPKDLEELVNVISIRCGIVDHLLAPIDQLPEGVKAALMIHYMNQSAELSKGLVHYVTGCVWRQHKGTLLDVVKGSTHQNHRSNPLNVEYLRVSKETCLAQISEENLSAACLTAKVVFDFEEESLRLLPKILYSALQIMMRHNQKS